MAKLILQLRSLVSYITRLYYISIMNTLFLAFKGFQSQIILKKNHADAGWPVASQPASYTQNILLMTRTHNCYQCCMWLLLQLFHSNATSHNLGTPTKFPMQTAVIVKYSTISSVYITNLHQNIAALQLWILSL